MSTVHSSVTPYAPESTNLVDFNLAKQAASGSREAFEKLCHGYRPLVYGQLLRQVGNHAEAEDLTQEVFLKLCTTISTFRGESAFGTWLYRCAHNTALMNFRKQKARQSNQHQDIDDPAVIVSCKNANAGTIVNTVILKKALENLPPGYRSVLLLHDLAGFEHEEISKKLGCTSGTSKSQLYKARMKMANMLGKKKKLSLSKHSAPLIDDQIRQWGPQRLENLLSHFPGQELRKVGTFYYMRNPPLTREQIYSQVKGYKDLRSITNAISHLRQKLLLLNECF